MLAPQPWLHRTFHTKELAHGYYGARVGISVIIVLSAVYRSIENLIPVFRLLAMWKKNTLFFFKKKKVILQKANNFYREEGKYSAQSTVEAVDLKQLLLLIFFSSFYLKLFLCPGSHTPSRIFCTIFVRMPGIEPELLRPQQFNKTMLPRLKSGK